jgi:hypothetical protein
MAGPRGPRGAVPPGAARGRHRQRCPIAALCAIACAQRERKPGREDAAQCILGRRSHGGSCPFRLCPPLARGLRAAAAGPHAGPSPAAQHCLVSRGHSEEGRGDTAGLAVRTGDLTVTLRGSAGVRDRAVRGGGTGRASCGRGTPACGRPPSAAARLTPAVWRVT